MPNAPRRLPRVARPSSARVFGFSPKRWSIAFCKLVVVLTLLPLASECEGKTCEAAPFAGFVECVWMQKSECETRVKPLSQKGFTSIVRITRMQVAAYDRAAASPHSDGHRLANGLLAPRLC